MPKGRNRRTSDFAKSDFAELQQRRWANLGRLLGFASGLFNHRVIEAARQRGYPTLKISHSHLMRGMKLEGSRITDLADRASISKQAMSAIAADMTRLGYVTSALDVDDHRAKRVKYTKKGLRLVQDIVHCAENVQAEFDDVLGARRAKEFRKSLEMLFDALTPQDVANESGWVEG